MEKNIGVCDTLKFNIYVYWEKDVCNYMEIPKYIQNKIKQQIDACEKAMKLEREIENWCQLSGFDPYSKEYKEIKGRLADAVAPLNADKIKEIADKIQWDKG